MSSAANDNNNSPNEDRVRDRDRPASDHHKHRHHLRDDRDGRERDSVKKSPGARDSDCGGQRRSEHSRGDRDHYRNDRHHRRSSDWGDRDYSRRERGDWRGKQRSKRVREQQQEEAMEEEGPHDPNRPSWENSKVRKHAEMLQQRKLLWKGQQQTEQMPQSSAAKSPNEPKEKKLEHKWESMIAATARDTQQMDKFQRLMGMKKNAAAPPATEGAEPVEGDTAAESAAESSAARVYGPAPAAAASAPADPELERERVRQLDLQRGLDKQFELARQSHHMARGRGLGSL